MRRYFTYSYCICTRHYY